MDGFKKFLAPLGIFIVGMFVILFLFVFFPSIGNAQSAAVTEIGPTKMSAFTGLSWAMTSTRLLLFAGLLMFVLILVAIRWLKRK